MGNHKAFTIYALTLVAGVASVLTASITVGFATVPDAVTFIEHLLLALAIRAAYKWLNGFDWSDWSVMGEHTGTVMEPVSQPSAIADATS